MSMNFRRKLPVPKEIKELYPLNDKIKAIKTERDAMIADVFTGKSDKFLLIIGPCSADNEDSVMDYTCRLSRLQEQVKDKIIIIPRIYTNKPRTTGEGAFKTAYDVMNNWGANHGAISCGHIGADLITLCSMLRIPVSMHNVPEDQIFRPAAWNAFGMDKEGQDYRACAAYGPFFKR